MITRNLRRSRSSTPPSTSPSTPRARCGARARTLTGLAGVAATALVTAAAAFAFACNSLPVHPLDDDDDDDAGDAGEAPTPPPPPVELGRHAVHVTDTRKIVPSDGLPPDAPAGVSNNNLDVVRFGGRVYLVYRTAPDHFASGDTTMVIVSSTDETTWTLERTFAIGTDLREPRFLALGPTLLCYFARLGTDPSKFEPQGTSVSVRGADGKWSDFVDVRREDADGGVAPMTDYIAWRTKIAGGHPLMTAYSGGEHIYDFDGVPLDVNLLTTDDGVLFRGMNPGRPVIYHGGGSETDVAVADDGSLFGVIRDEEGDETGFGSKVCRAPAGDWSAWSCKTDPRKYDSPLMFWYDGEAYLIGRRNVTATGNYDLGKPAEDIIQTALQYQIDYRSRPKRCSLWRYVQGEDRIAFILDFPSRGDTCYAGMIDGASPSEKIVYDYSSDIDGPDVNWSEGQVEDTFIYRHVVEFAPR